MIYVGIERGRFLLSIALWGGTDAPMVIFLHRVVKLRHVDIAMVRMWERVKKALDCLVISLIYQTSI